MDTTTTECTTRFRAWSVRLSTALLGVALALPAFAQSLAPGEFEWTPEASTAGPVVMIASLPLQQLHVYRDGVRIGVSTISSGKPGHETPTGTFEILEKRRDHRSNLYNNAPMPFMQRLTWHGIALHGGRIPGHPASHGCIRLPHEFAQALFEVTQRGYMVVVADEASHEASVVYPGERAPVDAYSGLPLERTDRIAGGTTESTTAAWAAQAP